MTKQSKFFNELQTVRLRSLSRACFKIASAEPALSNKTRLLRSARNDRRETSARNDTFYKGVKNIFSLTFAFLIFIFAFSSSSFAEDIYESRLDRGLENNEPYSYVLIKRPTLTRQEPIAF